MPRPWVPEKKLEENVQNVPTSDLLTSVRALRQQQEVQMQELMAEQTAKLLQAIELTMHTSNVKLMEVQQVDDAKIVQAFATGTASDSGAAEGTLPKRRSKTLGCSSTDSLEKYEGDYMPHSLPMTQRVMKIVQTCLGSAAEAIPAVLILTNAILFGIQADYAVQQPSHEVPDFFRTANLTFTVCFTLELVLRMCFEGRYLFSYQNPDIKWNVMDAVLVAFSVVEEMVTRTSSALKGAPNMSSARILRLLRLVRVARVLRVLRFFSDLRVMILGVLNSLKALMWALILLSFIIYIAAVCILQFVGEHLADNPQDFPSGPLQFSGLSPFSSLGAACFTLFLTISGGISWGELAPTLMMVSPVLTPVLTLYVSLAMFCVLNIVTGVFVDRSAAMALQDEENMMLEEIQERKRWIREIEHLFTAADTDHSGNVEWEEFKEALTDFRVQVCFKNLGIDIHKVSLEQIWQLIDYEDKGHINISEFADCLMEMHGVAHSIDVARLRHEQQRTQRKLESMLRMCETNFETLQIQMARFNKMP